MKVFFHIGLRRCASTSLRLLFGKVPGLIFFDTRFSGAESLYQEGTDPVKLALLGDLLQANAVAYDAGAVRGAFEQALARAEEAGAEIVGFAQENVLGPNINYDCQDRTLMRIRDALGRDIQIVMVVREQFAMLRSIYCKMVEYGLAMSWREFVVRVAMVPDRGLLPMLRFSRVIDLVQSYFDDVTVLVFEAFVTDAEVRRGFLKGLGVSASDFPVDLCRENSSLSPKEISARLVLNGKFPHYFGATSLMSLGNYRTETFAPLTDLPGVSDVAREYLSGEEVRRQTSGRLATALGEMTLKPASFDMPEALAAYLKREFAPENSRLGRRLGQDLGRYGYVLDD